METPHNLLTEWATLLLATIADAGVEHLVVSPGSRSTPFLAAAIGVGRFQLHDAIDERAGSFLALGIARATARPSALLCTSGSAAAHYYPAIVEANLAHVPMVVVTADRPPELQDCGAAQTIDQVKLYGEHVRKFVDIGMPSAEPSILAALRRSVAQAVTASRFPIPGPVHINARARKPLEPEQPKTDEARALADAVRSIRQASVPTASLPSTMPDPAAVAELARACAGARRGLILCGPAPMADAAHRDAVFALAKATQFPLLSEVPSQMRLADAPQGVPLCDPFDLVLRSASFQKAAKPDLILQIGGTPTSGAWEGFAPRCDRQQTRHVVVARHAWIDPHGVVSDVCLGDPAQVLVQLGAAVSGGAPSEERASWCRMFENAATQAWAAVDEDLASERVIGEGAAVRTVVGALPSGSVLVVGNSLAVRHLDMYTKRGAADVGIICQRGANGIDGFVAGTAGTVRALKRPVALLLGDVTLFHDLTSLALLADSPAPVVVIVIHNRGGRIFEQLPLASLSSNREAPSREVAAHTLDHIVTRHELDFSHAARLFGMAYASVDSVAQLRTEVDAAFQRRQASLVCVQVTEHGAVEQLRRIVKRVGDAVQALVPT
jgi:2-succinyl-5-enolpyruvyl-6-hydroxy-3-cyclohexene-1-carboxylate synthase